MKKKLIIASCIISIMFAFTACGKKLAFVDTTTAAPTTEAVREVSTTIAETTPAVTEAPTTVAETTPVAETKQIEVIHDVIVETVPVYQDVVSPYRDTKAVATVLATYNNPKYVDSYAVFEE